MASPNTKKIMLDRQIARMDGVRIVTIEDSPGPNRAERRRAIGKTSRRIARRLQEEHARSRGIEKSEAADKERLVKRTNELERDNGGRSLLRAALGLKAKPVVANKKSIQGRSGRGA